MVLMRRSSFHVTATSAVLSLGRSWSTQPIRSASLVDNRHVEIAEPRPIADDLDLSNLSVRDLEGERSGESSLRRHYDADGPIHERGPHDPREVPEDDRLLRPDCRAEDLGRRAHQVRPDHELRT